MKILNNKGQVVFSGDWYPSGVTVYMEKQGKDVWEDSPIDFLKNMWEGSDHSQRPLSSFFSMFPFMLDTTADDVIMYIDGTFYRIPFDVREDDSKEAWNFWQNILSIVYPSYTLVDDN